MAKIKTCTECGLPYRLGMAHNWQPNGAITEKKDQGHRMLFLESESFDPLFHKIGEMVGMPIEHIVQEGKRKVARQYLEKQLPKIVRRGVYAVYPRLITQKLADMTRCLGLGGLEAIFEELEAELGEDIPETVIEAQRVFARTAFRGDDWLDDEVEFRRKLALRGLGQLSSFSREGGELNLTLQNSCVPLFMVGMAKGLFELKTGREKSRHAWSQSADGDLAITIS